MAKKQTKPTVKPNSILVPLRTKVNKAGVARLEFSKGYKHDLSYTTNVKAPNGSVTTITTRYLDGTVQTVSGDIWECVPWDKAKRKGPKLAEYVAIK